MTEKKREEGMKKKKNRKNQELSVKGRKGRIGSCGVKGGGNDREDQIRIQKELREDEERRGDKHNGGGTERRIRKSVKEGEGRIEKRR